MDAIDLSPVKRSGQFLETVFRFDGAQRKRGFATPRALLLFAKLKEVVVRLLSWRKVGRKSLFEGVCPLVGHYTNKGLVETVYNIN